MRLTRLLVVALLMSATARAAECAAGDEPGAPEPNKVGAVAYPTAALMDGVEGRGVARVTVNREGDVSDGTIVTDQPAGYRLGQAALNTLLMDSSFKRGHPGAYQICFDFRLAESRKTADAETLPDAPTLDGDPSSQSLRSLR